MSPLHEEDVRMLDYFWNEKGDLERWCGWEGFVQKHPNHPIVDAWHRHQAADAALTLLIRGLRP